MMVELLKIKIMFAKTESRVGTTRQVYTEPPYLRTEECAQKYGNTLLLKMHVLNSKALYSESSTPETMPVT